MTDSPLFVSFLWHMHQPFYKDPLLGMFRLPWVRLHSTKDYLDMIEILRDFPAVKQTFNLTPSLLEQIIEYTDNNARDSYLDLTRKHPSEMTKNEKLFLLENFFFAHWDNMIRLFPRYYELLSKRGLYFSKKDLSRNIAYFNDNDFIDLQVLFNLVWIDPLFRKRDEFLSTLVRKGSNFTEEEKNLLVAKQMDIMKKIIPTYREMSEKGQIEVSFSPYYHPILPLLYDSDIAKVSMPDSNLPMRFSHPEDAEQQMLMGLDYFEKYFASRPSGMWPSEGSVSEDVCRMASKLGIRWIATDEDVLSRSLDISLRDSERNLINPHQLYRPYVFENVSILFRDHVLSDLIGFVYSQWEPKQAANDMINRLLHIHQSLPQNSTYIVPIILDGENAWEYYKNDGHDFLKYLYEGFSHEDRLKTITFSEYLSIDDSKEPLNKLYPGSWINSNYSIWIGHEEDNRAWDYLSETRDMLVNTQKTNPDRDYTEAWKSVYIAEGSDWNWWYGDDHITDTQTDFDELFRQHLAEVYRIADKEVPQNLAMPILQEDRFVSPNTVIRGFIDPNIDGRVTGYYEWYQGAFLDLKKQGGSMHRAESIMSGIYYGFNSDRLFMRLDTNIESFFMKLEEHDQLAIIFLKPENLKIAVSFFPAVQSELLRKDNGGWNHVKTIQNISVRDILELGVSFHDLGVLENDEIIFSVSFYKNGDELERCPCRGYITLTVPSPHFESMMWY